MFDSPRLLLTLLPGAGVERVRYVLLRGQTVLKEGECALAQLPSAGAPLRAAVLARSSYFERAEAEVKSTKMLPFQARRLVDAALAFSEPYRLRFQASGSAARKELALLALAESDYSLALQSLGPRAPDCERLALVESALAALLAQETPEPAALLWQRGPHLLALVVEKGRVYFKLLDRGGEAAPELSVRLERARAALQAAARRLYPERELSLLLALGELAEQPEPLRTGAGGADAAASAALEARLQRRFVAAQPKAVLLWPELYGLPSVALAFDLLEPQRHQVAQARQAAWALGALLAVAAVPLAGLAFWNHAQWQQLAATHEAQRSALEAQAAALQARLPSAEQLAVLERQLRPGPTLTDFRIDSLLAWVSQITPPGATIRHLQATQETAPAATAAGAAPVPGLSIEVEWELRGDYPQVERLAAILAQRLGERAQLQSSQLSYLPDPADGVQARLSTTLLPQPGVFH